MFPIAVIVTYYILNYIFFCLIHHWLKASFPSYERKPHGKIVVFFFVFVIASLPTIGAFTPDSTLKFDLQALGNIWLGFWIYFASMLIIGTLIFSLLKKRGKMQNASQWHKVVFIALIAVTLCLNIYGYNNAHDTKVTSYPVTVEKASAKTDTLRIAFVADFHLGTDVKESMMKNMVKKINKCDPDVILIGGDIFNSSYGSISHPERTAKILRGLKAKYGVYAVYGNHDVEETLFGGFAISPKSEAIRSEEMENFIKDCGFKLLRDSVVTLPGTDIQLAGRVDLEKSGDGKNKRLAAEELLSSADKDKPLIVLEHEPADYDNLSQQGADLILSGHTHDGQIFPANVALRFILDNSYGLKKRGNTTTVVTSGVGLYGPPIRVGTISEITEIDVAFK